MLPLFAYGTLRDPEYQRELFGRTYPMQAAHVTGFSVYTTGGGYVAAAARVGGRIDGSLVDLDGAGYAIADAWEDLDVYDRIEIEVTRADGDVTRAFMYVQHDHAGVPVSDGRLADRQRADVVADIRRFRLSAAFTDRR